MSTIQDLAGPWHFDDLVDLPEDGRRYEVVDGSLVVSPPPTHWHQLVCSELLQQLGRQCPAGWRVTHELAVRMGTDGRVPDLAVFDARAPVRRGGPPYPVELEHIGLVVEVVSPSSRKTDRFAKPGEYAEAGIPLFWRVETDPDPLLLAHRVVSGRYEQVLALSGAGDVPVPWGTAVIDLSRLDDRPA